MHPFTRIYRKFGLSALVAIFIAAPALGDDTEIFQGTTVSAGAANILFIIDTSGSMGSTVTQRAPFDSAHTYDSGTAGDCDPAKIYYVKSGTPNCSSNSFASTSMKCTAANTALAGGGTYSATGGVQWTTLSSTQTATAVATTTTKTQPVNATYNVTVVTVATVTHTTTLVQQIRNSNGNVNATLSTTTTPDVPSGTPTSNTTQSSTSTSNNGSSTTTNTVGSPVIGTPTTSTTYSWSSTIGAAATSSNSTSNSTVGPTITTTQGTAALDPGKTPNPKVTTSSNTTNTVLSVFNNPLNYTAGGRSVHDRTTITQYFVTTTTTTITYYKRPDVQTTVTVKTATTTATVNTPSGSDVQCDGDKNNAGSLGFPNNVSPGAGTEWTSNKNNSYWDTGGALQKYTFYSGNFLNYLTHDPGTVLGTRLQVVQQAADKLIDQLSAVNVGLMRYSVNSSSDDELKAQGGFVSFAMSPVDTNKAAIKTVIDSYTADGWTPLSETLYEAYLYYSGGNVAFGNTSGPIHSVDGSRTSAGGPTYKTPITGVCQQNFIVYLTDGLPTQDNQADGSISGLGVTCDDTTKAPYGSGWGPGQTAGKCLAGLAGYMANHDMSPLGTAADPQVVKSYFIGFGSDFTTGGQLNSAFDYLNRAATAGQGKAYQASDLEGLTTALSDITHDIAARNTSFISPTVAVNAFNRTQTLNDLYVSVFQPSGKTHWPGNVKKYHVKSGQIVDANDNPAVNPATGFFNHNAQSVWSSIQDGESVPLGGAANKLPNPGTRNVYTWLGANPSSPTDVTFGASGTAYLVDKTNTAITGAMLGLPATGTPTRDSLLDWMRGMDIDNVNGNGATASRNVMGDPVHAKPAIVIYGGTEANPDAVIYAPTNDGYLHAIGSGDSDGVELWSFIPQELLSSMANLHADPASSIKHYALDGDVRVLKYDVNGNDLVDSGDRVVLYFGQGRGGSNYYAIDVTDKLHPTFMWTIGAAQLNGIGQAWSSPTLARVNISGAAQNSQKLVLIFGGGYDPAEDTNPAAYNATDSVGKKIFMVDAISGALLWSAGSSSSTLTLAKMDHAIPSDVTVLDLDGNGYADRMYVGDVAGQLWRFDITNGNTAGTLVTGGVIASLGSHDETPSHTTANNRRFYYPPDVALVDNPIGGSYLNIAIGTGYRGHPLNTATHDAFYAIRDKNTFNALTQAQYSALTVIGDGDVNDITTNIQPTIAATSPGWKLSLDYPSGWVGEKVLAGASTLNNQIVFTTYTPTTVGGTSACNQQSVGKNRAYTVSVFDGSPVRVPVSVGDPTGGDDGAPVVGSPPGDEVDGTGQGSAADRYVDLAQTGIAPEVVMLFPGGQNPLTCISGAEKLPDGSCPKGPGTQKTYWRQSGVE